MGTIHQKYLLAKQLEAELLQVVDDIAFELSDEIVNLNKSQLEEGISGTGEMIGDKDPFFTPHYFERHEAHRMKRGLQTSFIDLKFTGKLHNSLFTESKGNNYQILSNDNPAKIDALINGGGSGAKSECGCMEVREGGFGEEIFELTQENAIDITNKGTSMFVNIVREIMQL